LSTLRGFTNSATVLIAVRATADLFDMAAPGVHGTSALSMIVADPQRAPRVEPGAPPYLRALSATGPHWHF